MSKDILKKVTSGVRTPVNIRCISPRAGKTKAVFMEYMKDSAAMEEENRKLKEEIRLLKNDRIDIINYLEMRIEECKLDRTYEKGIVLIGMRESIYQDILNKIEGDKNE